MAFFALRAKILLRKTIHNSPKKGRLSQTKAMVINMDASYRGIITAIMRFGLSPSIKALLRAQAIDCGDCREPFKKLSKEEEAELLMLVSEIERS